MKLLHVVASMNPISGGVCQAVRNLIEGLQVCDCYNEVVCLDAANSDYLKQDEFSTHGVGIGRGPWKFNKGLDIWLRDNLLRFDVVIIHGLWLYHTYAARRAIEHCQMVDKLDIRYYVMPHGMLDPWFQKFLMRPIKSIRNWLFWKFIEQRVVNCADGLLFTSDEECGLARKPFRPYHPRREVVVGLGVNDPPIYVADMKVDFEKKCPSISDRPYMLFLGRIHPKKGVDILIRAYSEISNTASSELEVGITPILVIAGPGLETKYGRAMRNLAKKLCPVDSVLFPGMLVGKSKWGAFYNCRSFILPSHQENFGIAVVEALACGKPVLISDQVNIWREIQQDGAGFVGADNLEGVIEILNEWLETSPCKQEQFSKTSRNCFVSRYNIQAAAKIFRDAIAN